MNADQMLDALRIALARYDPPAVAALPGRRNDQLAGVLVPLQLRGQRLVAIAGLRRRDLSAHGGEVCFPGGKPEPTDSDLSATALREANEEIGIAGAALLGRLTQMPLYTSDYRLAPFVAEIGETVEPKPDGSEIVELLEIDLGAELERHHIEGLPFKLGSKRGIVPMFRLRNSGGDERVMFGATACTCFELLLLLARATDSRLPPVVPSSLDWTDLIGRPNGPKQPPADGPRG